MLASDREILPISLDGLLLLILVPSQLSRAEPSYLLVIPLFFYIILELWYPISGFPVLPEKFGKVRSTFLARLFLLLIMITAATIIPTITRIGERYQLSQEQRLPVVANRDIHDGAVQVELALDFLSQGMNPYTESYKGSPLENYGFNNLEIRHNPAVDHLAYLPGYLLLSYPLHELFKAADLFYDQRMLYLGAYILMVLLLPQLVDAPSLKLTAVAAVGLNPLLTSPVILGMNDVLVLLPIVVMLLLLQRGYNRLGAVAIGVACALKQSAWFILPFYLLFMIPRVRKEHRIKEIAVLLGIVAMTAITICAPLALWDFGDFFTDVFSYPAGNVDINYPIRGYTFGTLLVGTGHIESPLEPFPFWLLQLFLGVPFIYLMLRYQSRRNELGFMILSAGIFTLGFGILSRFFQDNYVGYIAVLVIMGVIVSYQDSIYSLPQES